MSAEQRDADDKWDLTPSEDLNAKIAELHIGFTRLKENVGSFSTALDHLVSIRQENMRIESHNLSAQHVVNRSSATNDGRLVVTGDRVACTGVGCINFVCRTPWVLVLSGAVAAMIAFSRLARSKVGAQDKEHRAMLLRKPGLTRKGDFCDVAFLKHPASVLSVFDFWLPKKKPLTRWQPSWWMILTWPFIVLLSIWNLFINSLTHGPYLVTDTFRYCGLETQVWTSRVFGYQFFIKCLRGKAARGIVDAVREADRIGVSVLGLGALNKAEFINRGGEDILDTFQPRKTRVVHGNTLTAAVVVESVKAIASSAAYGSRRVFLTGSTSKVGRAVALKLAMEGFDVICCTRSADRFAALESELRELLQQRRRKNDIAGQDDHESAVYHMPTNGLVGEAKCAWNASREDHIGSSTGRANGTGPFPCARVDTGSCEEASKKQGYGIPGGHGEDRPFGRLLHAMHVDKGVHSRLWVIGKYDTSVRWEIALHIKKTDGKCP